MSNRLISNDVNHSVLQKIITIRAVFGDTKPLFRRCAAKRFVHYPAS